MCCTLQMDRGAAGTLVQRADALVAHARDALLGGRAINDNQLRRNWSAYLPALSYCLQV